MEELIGTIGPCSVHGGWCLQRAEHAATARREAVVLKASLDMNAKGVDYQPDQQWTAKRRSRRAK